jgi:hypothetical protein
MGGFRSSVGERAGTQKPIEIPKRVALLRLYTLTLPCRPWNPVELVEKGAPATRVHQRIQFVIDTRFLSFIFAAACQHLVFNLGDNAI